MKKAIIQTGGKQYFVSEGDTLEVECIKEAAKTVIFEPLLVIDGDVTSVGTPKVKDVKVSAAVIEAEKKADKVTSIRFKAKKRVHKLHGHRQVQTVLKITKIS